MIKIAIIRDEPIFGELSFKSIEKEFEVEMIEIETPSRIIIDEINLNNDIVKKLSSFDIIITYIKQMDATLEIVDILSNRVSCIIIGIWKGE